MLSLYAKFQLSRFKTEAGDRGDRRRGDRPFVHPLIGMLVHNMAAALDVGVVLERLIS